MHPSAMHCYMEVAGTLAVYTFDSVNNSYDDMPRTISVATNITTDYIPGEVVEAGDEVLIECDVIKIGKVQALL